MAFHRRKERGCVGRIKIAPHTVTCGRFSDDNKSKFSFFFFYRMPFVYFPLADLTVLKYFFFESLCNENFSNRMIWKIQKNKISPRGKQ